MQHLRAPKVKYYLSKPTFFTILSCLRVKRFYCKRIMSISVYSYLLSGIMLITGILFCRIKPTWHATLYNFFRSKTQGFVWFWIAAIWVLWNILHLSPADFGQYKHIFFIVFGTTFIATSIYWQDWLVVRGLSILYLLVAYQLLEATYMQYEPVKPYLSFILYVGILLAMYLGSFPYRVRDFLQYAFKRLHVFKIIGIMQILYAALLIYKTLK